MRKPKNAFSQFQSKLKVRYILYLHLYWIYLIHWNSVGWSQPQAHRISSFLFCPRIIFYVVFFSSFCCWCRCSIYANCFVSMREYFLPKKEAPPRSLEIFYIWQYIHLHSYISIHIEWLVSFNQLLKRSLIYDLS